MSLETMESKYSYGMLSENTVLVFIKNFVRFFKTYPEIRSQYFVFLNNLSEEEMRISPRLQSHASGVVLGITQIINGLENPVQIFSFQTLPSNTTIIILFDSQLLQLVVAEVANKFAKSHFCRGVRDTNVRLLTKIVMDYLQVQSKLIE